MYPLCQGVSWGGNAPYNYEMKYFNNTVGFQEKASVDGLAVSLGHIMYAHWTPSKYGFMYIPKQMTSTNNQPNLIATLFKDISNDLGMVNPTTQAPIPYIPGAAVHSIPNILETKYEYNNGGNIILYNNDENSLLQVYQSLRRYSPVLFAEPAGARDERSYPAKAWVVDGYREVKVQVTKKTKLLGITLTTKVYEIYSDYFHFIFPYNGSGNGWYIQHYRGSANVDLPQIGIIKYAIINIRP